jgi:hypothetical protein
VVFVVAVGLATVTIRHGWRRVLLVVAAVAGPWFVASWVLLGSAIPDTLIIKADQGGALGQHDYLTGPLDYLRARPWDISLALAPAVLGLAGLVGWLLMRSRARRERLAPVAAIGAGAIAYYGVYCVLSVPPYHWYYVAPIAGLSLVALVLGAEWLSTARAPLVLAAAPVGVLVALAVGTAIADLAQGVPWRSPVIFGNYASAQDYARVGIALRGRIPPDGVESPGEIGTLAYFCNCPIIDEFSDRGLVVRRVNDHIHHGAAVKRLLLAVNYLWLDRDQKPRRPRVRLVFGPGPGTQWHVWSAAYGHHDLRLVPVE